ncbi:cytochrome c [Roseimicrobium gellanilyticum]|uniref:Cytochrome c n=1 Tax=Roseimicrobium gellanilyticum TaxID=748857 RepID=A0A366HWH5_9BACT|nr:PSD1 and planctomycete cytochrome C domain-containing protein [Roseimicrobium gellanilyticum]RBP47845.1 cytochrome c [Roseimicrobium gellanilyticum]
MKTFFPPLASCLALTALLVPAHHAQAAGKINFNRDVRPILSDNCFACHGFDAKKRKADLRLDVPEGAYKADKDGAQPIKPGSPDASSVWQRIITTDPDDLMPPADSHKKLTPQQREILKRWIEEGAEYQQHWSFITPSLPPVPNLKSQISDLKSAANPIDAFINARLAEEGLKQNPEADKETLIRRVTLDLTGLSPTPEEVDAFLADNSPQAYERVVDRLLKSSRYGEHMGRHWLDLARYADTHGLHLDNERSMWPYRDWVVKAFNDNLHFDDFTRWQLAGDLLPNPTREQDIASGFNRCNVTTSEGGSINEEFVFRYAVDRTSTAVEVWMGLTAGCAVCHDHKFDPLSQKEFYSMYAFFNSAADPPMDGNKIDTPPIMKLTNAEQETKLKELEQKIAGVQNRIKETIAKMDYKDPSSVQPPPSVQESEVVWFEDGFPPAAKPQASGAPLCIVSTNEGGQVFSGGAALKRAAKGLEQDFFNGGVEYVVPQNGRIFVHCYLDPQNPPKTIMVQFHTTNWLHRAVWGAEDLIPFGKPKSTEKVSMGALPAAGKWVKLEIVADRMGLKAGTKVNGYAFTQFDGTVYWDKLGVKSRVDPAKDPAWSFDVWANQNQGRRVEALPEDLRNIVRGKKRAEWNEAELKRIKEFWLGNLYVGAQEIMAPMLAERAPIEEEKKKVEATVPITFVMRDMETPRETFVMERGQYDKPGEKVTRGVPAALPPLPKKDAGNYNRLDFANWLVSREHPLTSRVSVNRFWQQFFGTGLVKTSADFGSQGEPPSHPELLDWLSVTFMESGWDVKALVKTLVCSETYKQSTKVTPALLAKDPENRLYARGPRFRLDAEVLRDNALFVSGLMDPTMGGKGVKPYQPPNIWEPVGFGGSNTREYKQDSGNALYRRSLYTFLKRTAPPPFMTTFDAPNREQSCTRRERSNTPLQALQLMNDVQHFEAARQLAQRMLKEGGATAQERITWAWRVTTSRRPLPEELALVEEALKQHLARYQANAEAAKQVVTYGESKSDEKLNVGDLAAYTMIANLLLNLDETVTKN